MLRAACWFVLVSSLLAGPLACGRSAAKSACDKAAPVPKSQQELPSTSAQIFLNNLRGQIETQRRLLRVEPEFARHCLALNSSLFAMAQYLGDATKLHEALQVLDSCSASSSNASFALARAGQLQSLHLFREASKELEKARDLGAAPELLEALQEELDWNTGKYDRLIDAMRARARQAPSVKSLARLALLEHSLGNYDEADRLFEKAEKKISNTDPLTIAWLFVQRGHHHMELGEYPSAEAFFRAAVSRLPSYVAATEHLGEVLALQNKLSASAKMYELTLEHSDNPEFMGALASVYESLGRTEEAVRMRRKATDRFRELIEKFPESMSWHAAEFFLDSGDPDQAHALLIANSELRPNSDSWLGLAKAQLAKGQARAAKLSIEKALAMPLVSVDLYETALLVDTQLGNSAAMKRHAAKSAKLRSRISARFKDCR